MLYPPFMRTYWNTGFVQRARSSYEADMLERVQRRGTRMVKSLSGLSYEDTLTYFRYLAVEHGII